MWNAIPASAGIQIDDMGVLYLWEALQNRKALRDLSETGSACTARSDRIEVKWFVCKARS